ncbi:MAG: methyltransferase domain-containing protein [Lachnospiraceae bacterium]|nr:methyltransferase domain-containing protein [Lachnospiraceae bacterium]
MWNAESYNRFGKERMQPSIDLVSRLRGRSFKRILDAGCGTGMSTAALCDAWQHAEIIGADLSLEMLEEARKRLNTVTFLQKDCGRDLSSLGTFDLIFSNAFLQWLPDQKQFIADAFAMLREHGVFAAQIPLFAEMPAHACVERAERLLAEPLQGIEAEKYVLHAAPDYYNMLAAHTSRIEMWITEYCHEMDSPESILRFIQSTALRPHSERLNAEEMQLLLTEVLHGLEQAYPRQKNGNVLFPFKRLFLIGEK